MEKQKEIAAAEATRYQILPGYLKVVFVVLSLLAMGFNMSVMFSIPIGSRPLLPYANYYLLIALLSPCGFLILPRKDRRPVWYDLVAATLSFGIPFYFFLHASEIMFLGWIPPTALNWILGLILCLLVLELGRRISLIYAAICLVFGLWPLFADRLPGVFTGVGYSLPDTVAHFVFGGEGLLGLPTATMGGLLMGFLVFSGIMAGSGAAGFFLDVSLALLGRYRGGPAKVAVVASGFFGSLSGSAFANIAGTGCFTIPAMKRLGYPPHYAAAIEACASSGGNIMPPVMGAAAFLMAVLLEMPYATIVIAAIIPAIFYYFGLTIQVDAVAARGGLKGLPREEIPSLTSALKKGWVFLSVLIFLVWGLVYMKWEAVTPWYASGLLFLLSFTSRETMMTPKRILKTIAAVGQLITQTMVILLPMSFLTCAVFITGASSSLTAGLIRIVGSNVFLLLLMGIVICYIMGMVGVAAPVYIFLAVTMAPAVVEIAGLNILAVHLFIVYYIITTAITPPVAVASFFAAALAGSPPLKTAFTSMRLGVVIYFVPIFFIFNPVLILQGPLLEIIYWFVLGLLGIFLIAAGMEGYFLKLGVLRLYERVPLVIAGVLFAYPESTTTIIGAALALFTIGVAMLRRKFMPAD